MVKLSLQSNVPSEILKYTFMCLGKESIPFQELVFFMAFDLKLYSPSNCEKVIEHGKKTGHIDVSQEKIVTFNIGMLDNQSGERSTNSIKSMIKALSTKISLDKAFGIDSKRVSRNLFNEDKNLILAEITSHQGGNVKVRIDGARREVLQQGGEESAGDIAMKKFSKYIIKILLVNKDMKGVNALIEDIYKNKKDWKFTYKKSE
ncbi:MAG: hypothetical protein ACTSUE_03515 [Promethearchaeota archaeon]